MPSDQVWITLITGVVTLGGAFFAYMAARDAKKASAAAAAALLESAATKVIAIETKEQTNGMKHELVQAVKEAAHASGKLEGKAEEKLETRASQKPPENYTPYAPEVPAANAAPAAPAAIPDPLKVEIVKEKP